MESSAAESSLVLPPMPDAGGGSGISIDRANPPPTPTTERTQALKDLKLTIEYKHLKQNAPSGVLVTPSFDDLRRWHGVIFVRKGFYQGGVFKFTIILSKQYNDTNCHPTIHFNPSIYNPFITPPTDVDSNGLLDLRFAYPTWNPTTCFMVR